MLTYLHQTFCKQIDLTLTNTNISILTPVLGPNLMWHSLEIPTNIISMPDQMTEKNP